MLNTLPSELIGELASYLNIKERSFLSRISRNIHGFFNNPNNNNSNQFKEFRELQKLKPYQKLDPLNVGKLMGWAKNDIEIAKITLNDKKLLNKLNCSKNDYNIRRLARVHKEIAEMILNSKDILNELKAPQKTQERLERIMKGSSRKQVINNHL